MLEFAANGKPSVADVSLTLKRASDAQVKVGLIKAHQGPRQEHGEEALDGDHAPRLGHRDGLARLVDGVKLASGLWLADITDAIGVATFDYRTGAVPEFTFDAVDRDRKLSRRGLLREGTTLTYEGDVWQVAAVERSYKGDDIWLTFTARSRLSRRLRNMTGPKSAEKSTPQAWITAQVKKAGGRAVVEPGAGRMRIVQKRKPERARRHCVHCQRYRRRVGRGGWRHLRRDTLVGAEGRHRPEVVERAPGRQPPAT